jgi:GT2 family glycosyltransferase/SAM-dependent methyltransferase
MATLSVTGHAEPEGPLEAPPAYADTRAQLAAEFLRGRGLEIGAMNWPLTVPPGVHVTYVDHMPPEDQHAAHPKLEIARVDVIDDGERLETFAPESVDFIIANHFMEHTQDPIRTIETHLSKLRPGGILFYAVPDKRYTFDFRRPRTSLEHLIADYENGPEASRWEHFLEWERMVYEPGTAPPAEHEVRRKAAEGEATGFSIHFHVWTQADLLELLLYCQERFGSFELEAFTRRSIENIVVLRNHGEWVPMSRHEAATERPTVVRARSDGPRAADDGAVRLSALRMTLDESSGASSWPVGAEGIDGRALAQVADAPASFELRLGGPVTFSAEVRLGEHDWRDLRGSVRPWVATLAADGTLRELWSGMLTCAADGGGPGGLRVRCELPASTRTLMLGCDRRPPRRGPPVQRAYWRDPQLLDPSAPPPVSPPDDKAAAVAAGPLPGTPAPDGPMFSVLTPVHDPPPAMLEQAIASVLAQSRPDWELCLVDDGSTDPEVIAALQRHAAGDARVRLLRRDTPGGIASATNAALELATGRYVAMLDHDDMLEHDALDRVASAIAADPGLEMLYSDEDVVEDGTRIWRHLKPDWSPETICTSGYTCHLAVYRRSLMLELGGFRSDLDGSQDYDFVLRASERVDRVAHVPHVLYRWRAHAGSTAGGDSKQFAFVAARRAIAEHLQRTGRGGEVQFADSDGLYRVAPELAPSATAALIVPLDGDVASAGALERSARSWLSQSHPAWSVVLAGSGEAIEAGVAAFARAGVDTARVLTVATGAAADRAARLSAGADAAEAEHLVLMQAPVTGLTHDWLTRLLAYAAGTEIAAAGPLVLAPDGRIADSGVAIAGGMPVFLRHSEDGSIAGQFGFGTAVFNVTAVGEVLATRRDAFQALGGLREELGGLALVDYCLRAAERGLRTVTVADARVRSDDVTRRANDLPAIWKLAGKHAQRALDPYYNPGYRQDRADFTTLE